MSYSFIPISLKSFLFFHKIIFIFVYFTCRPNNNYLRRLLADLYYNSSTQQFFNECY